MKLAELYAQTPVDKHNNIVVFNDRVFVRDADGSVSEYLILGGGELWLVQTNKTVNANIAAIKQKVGA